MKGKQNRHEVFREPIAKKYKKNPLAELNSSKDDSDDNQLPVDTDNDYVLKASKKRKKRDRNAEHQLVDKINGIGFDESKLLVGEAEHPTEHEEDEPEQPYNGTPVRKTKKSKRATDKLFSIVENDQQSSEDIPQKPRKYKKSKRKLDEDDDDAMIAPEEKPAKQKKQKAKKVKLDESYEASMDEEDTVSKINQQQEALHALNTRKKNRKARKKEKNRAKSIAKYLAEVL